MNWYKIILSFRKLVYLFCFIVQLMKITDGHFTSKYKIIVA